MNVLVMITGSPYIEDATIFIPFTAIGKSGESVLQINFRVAYAWGSTLAQRRTAILNAANTARQQYEEAHGVTLPAVNAIEVFGIS